jgi:protein-S-isoprenylcysteine O-methyltransferase Ste14
VAVLSPALISASDAPATLGDRAAARERLNELFGKAAISCLFVVLAVSIGSEFLKTGHVTGLLLLVSELLVVLLTVMRRPAFVVDRTLAARVFSALSIVGVPLIRPAGVALAPDLATAAVSAFGLLVVIAGKLTLGRSFGLLPANRGVVSSGIYTLLRHPIYAGYLVTHGAFLVAHPTTWNLVMLVAADTALMVRAVYEERTLAHDPAYAEYMTRVQWRVCPGLF